jgi:hypothetical protein
MRYEIRDLILKRLRSNVATRLTPAHEPFESCYLRDEAFVRLRGAIVAGTLDR